MKKALKFTLISLGVLFVLGIIGTAIGGSDAKTSDVAKTDASSATNSSNSSNSSKSYVKILGFSGNGKKKSPVFELHGNHARIKYTYRSDSPDIGILNVYVTPDGEDIAQTGGIPEVMTTAAHENSESALQKSAGKYYLDVDATGSWSITVEEEQ